MPKFIDLQGQKFKDWEVLEYVGKGLWKCRCSCGVIRNVMGKSLRGGLSKSCGHATNKLKDMTGCKINEWTVVGYAGEGSWNCICSCGKESIVHGYDLRNNNSKDCGHSRKESLIKRNKDNRIKLEGTTINDWSIQEYLGHGYYRCKCSCGKIKIVASKNLMRGQSKSCGHNNGREKIRDITGMEFGELTVIGYLGQKKWACKCSCGEITSVSKGNLLNGSTVSCGCKQYNKLTTNDILNAVNVFKNETGEDPFVGDLADLLGLHPGNVNRWLNKLDMRHVLNKTFRSRLEMEIYMECVNMYNGIIEVNNRNKLNGLELDIYFPEKNLALEINGTYWHGSNYKTYNYHQNKTVEAAKKGIRLIHIFEYEWDDLNQRSKILGVIGRALEVCNVTKIYARECDIKIVGGKEAEEFNIQHHLQGHAAGSINIGCYFNGRLVGLLVMGKPRFNNEYEYEIIRLTWMANVNVIGGLERLFKAFVTKYKPKSIITYCDISKFTGKSYQRIGFNTTKESLTRPNYKWVDERGNVYSRYQTQKQKLLDNGLGNYGETENEIMTNLGFYKIYDAGNLRMIWTKQ